VQNNKFVLIFLVCIFAGCSDIHPKGVSNDLSSRHFLGLYVSYLMDIENRNFPDNIEEHFSSGVIDEIKKEYKVSVITLSDAAWLIQSSYMPVETIKQYYLKYDNDESACFTVIGKSLEGLPMYVSLMFSEHKGDNWKINKVSAEVFDESIEPSFPKKAVCLTL